MELTPAGKPSQGKQYITFFPAWQWKGGRQVKLSKAEWAALLVGGAFLLFFGGWYLRGATSAANTYVISAQRPAADAASPIPEPSFLPEERLDLNEATLEDLRGLPGIGAVRAQAILDYRERHGPFTRPEQLTQVEGIGQSTYEALEDYITVKEAETP